MSFRDQGCFEGVYAGCDTGLHAIQCPKRRWRLEASVFFEAVHHFPVLFQLIQQAG